MKTKTINDKVLGYLEIIKYKDELIAVDKEVEKKRLDKVYNDESGIYIISEYNPTTGIARDNSGLPFVLDAFSKVIAASKELSLVLPIIPEVRCSKRGKYRFTEEDLRKAFISGAKVGFATEENVMKYFWKPYLKSISNSAPKGIWVELEESLDTSLGIAEMKYILIPKILGNNELIIVETEK